MERYEAKAAVERVTRKIEQYSAVSHSDALSLLGQETFDRMIKNAVRKLGPAAGFVYPWNVVDYLHQPSLGQEKINAPVAIQGVGLGMLSPGGCQKQGSPFLTNPVTPSTHGRRANEDYR